MRNKILLMLFALVLIGVLVWVINSGPKTSGETITIGVITDLSGPAAAYWGESTRVGAEIARKELLKEGYNVRLVFEDYQLDATKALTAVQKLVDIDHVDAIYSDFNPAAISVGSFLKDKKILHIFDAAITSPLAQSPYTFKTYLDWQAGCRELAIKFKKQGVEKLGVLKINLEAGELCLRGVKEVYGQNLTVESYNLTDFSLATQVAKLKNAKVKAIINGSFEDGTLATFKSLRELKFKVPVGTIEDTITENVKTKYPVELIGTQTFGFMPVASDFVDKVKVESGKNLLPYAAALSYTHIKQIVKAEAVCNRNIDCVAKEIAKSPADNTIGFIKFADRIAELKTQIRRY